MDNTRNHISSKLLEKRESLMLHAIGFVTGDPSVRISNPHTFRPGVQVTTAEAGDSKWLYMMLPVTQGSLITDIRIAHHRTGLRSHVAIIRLVEQQEPVAVEVAHNEMFDEALPGTCVVSSACWVIVKHAVLLKVCLDFADSADIIELGSVEVSYIPGYTSLPEYRKEVKSREMSAQKEGNGAGLFSIRHSLNFYRPPLLDMVLQKKRKTVTK